jgi:hypothetical protein
MIDKMRTNTTFNSAANLSGCDNRLEDYRYVLENGVYKLINSRYNTLYSDEIPGNYGAKNIAYLIRVHGLPGSSTFVNSTPANSTPSTPPVDRPSDWSNDNRNGYITQLGTTCPAFTLAYRQGMQNPEISRRIINNDCTTSGSASPSVSSSSATPTACVNKMVEEMRQNITFGSTGSFTECQGLQTFEAFKYIYDDNDDKYKLRNYTWDTDYSTESAVNNGAANIRWLRTQYRTLVPDGGSCSQNDECEGYTGALDTNRRLWVGQQFCTNKHCRSGLFGNEGDTCAEVAGGPDNCKFGTTCDTSSTPNKCYFPSPSAPATETYSVNEQTGANYQPTGDEGLGGLFAVP